MDAAGPSSSLNRQDGHPDSHTNQEMDVIDPLSNLNIDPDNPAGLSLIQEHLLKRELVNLQIDAEVARLDDFKNIGRFGSPFIESKRVLSRTGRKASTAGQSMSVTYCDGYVDFPILRNMFVNCVKTFPFISAADEVNFWQGKVQPFIESFADKDISSTADREEATKRRRIGAKIKKLIFVYSSAGLRTTRPEERNVIVSSASQRGVQQIDPKQAVGETLVQTFVNGYDVTVEGVRCYKIRRGFLYEKKCEYIVRAQMEGAPAMYVARTYMDFKELDQKLHREFPGRGLPTLPSKNNSHSSVSTESDQEDGEFDDESDGSSRGHSRNSSDGSGSDAKRLVSKMFGLRAAASPPPPSVAKGFATLPQEKQRVTLRVYIKKLIAIPKVTKSSIFLEFLFKDRLRSLTPEEQEDIALRRKKDIQRISDQVRFFELAKLRARHLENHLTEFKRELLEKNGLVNVFGELREKTTVQELSPKFKNFIEWATIEFAATLYSIFIAHDNSPEIFSQVKRLHRLMPYTLLKGVLRYSNPVAVMKGITDLFLAQPFGKRSLMQNLLMVVLSDDIKAKEKEIAALKAKMDTRVVEVVVAYTDAEPEIKALVHSACEENGTDLALQIFQLANAHIVQVSSDVVTTVELWHADWELCNSGRANEAIDVDNADSYVQIKSLIGLIVRKRDKDMMHEFWAEGVTVQLLKELITVFYGPLIQVFKSANIHESVNDFEKFMDDLIKVVNKSESSGSFNDPNQQVQVFIDLCYRHRNSLIKFIHEMYVNDNGLLDGILRWMSDIIEFLRNGCKDPLNLIQVVDNAHRTGVANKDAIKAELDSIYSWLQAVKTWREEQIDRREQQGDNWEEAVPSGVITGKDFGLAHVSVFCFFFLFLFFFVSFCHN